jgi:hypothetical protein
MNGIQLGKIESVKLGVGGYDDAMFGFSFVLGGKGWGVSDFWETWSTWDEGCKWSVYDQNKMFLESLLKIKDLLKAAKVSDFSKLAGIPIEATFKENTLDSWRILEEVLG